MKRRARKPQNPFVVKGYFGPSYFCGRTEETKRIVDAATNGRNVTLISQRRMGKTSLIHHIKHQMKDKATVLIDIYATQNLEQFISKFAKEIVRQYGTPNESFLKKAGKLFTSFNLKVGYDPTTSVPELGIEYLPNKNPLNALAEIFAFLEGEKQPVLVAIDEFQQIAQYPEKNIEALLREHVQVSGNVQFIFSGSDRRLMTSIFTDTKRPFYQSTDLVYLEKIPSDVYLKFINAQLKKVNAIAEKEDILNALEWCGGLTYYIQRFFNRMASLGLTKYSTDDFSHIKEVLVLERESEFQLLRNLLPKNQWQLIIALAKEKGTDAPTSGDFIKKYDLSASSTVAQNLSVLVEKDLVMKEGDEYKLADIFFQHWLIRTYE